MCLSSLHSNQEKGKLVWFTVNFLLWVLQEFYSLPSLWTTKTHSGFQSDRTEILLNLLSKTLLKLENTFLFSLFIFFFFLWLVTEFNWKGWECSCSRLLDNLGEGKLRVSQGGENFDICIQRSRHKGSALGWHSDDKDKGNNGVPEVKVFAGQVASL